MIACIILLLWLKRLFTSGRQKAQLSNTQSNLPWPANIFFSPKDSPVAEEHEPLEKKWSFCVCLFAYLFWIDQTKKKKKKGVWGFTWKRALYPCIFLGWKVFQTVEDICFSTDFSYVYPPCPTLHQNLSLFLMLVVELLRCMSGLVWVGWRTMVQKEKRKKPSVLINLAKWSEHFLRETMLHVGKIEAGARPFMLTARCKWMQTHLPKNSHVSKNEFGVQGPQTIPDLTVFYP